MFFFEKIHLKYPISLSNFAILQKFNLKAIPNLQI